MLERVEKYEVIGEIGHGGMATVYRARDIRLDRLVALKVMHPHLQGAKEARQRFAREALTVARLHHPSILEIYDYSGEDSDVRFIATELLTGPTLKQFADQHPDLPAEIAACIAIQVARALSVAHAEGVVHRDVKPENIMLHENRGVKLTDFGIAQLVDMQSMTTTGQVLGSPAHMAPEQIEGRGCDARSDLFALGTVLYMLATAELPFTGTNPHQVLKRIMDGAFPDPLRRRPAIGAHLSAIIRRLLEVDPARRYQNADELERDLCAFLAESGIESPDATLARYLADPAGVTAELRVQTIAHLTELGEQAQRRNQLPLALDHYNRVLALDESNPRVLAAVQSIGQRAAFRRSLARGASVALLVGLLGAALYTVAAKQPPPAGDLGQKPAQPPSGTAPSQSTAPRKDPLARTLPASSSTPKPAPRPGPSPAQHREHSPSARPASRPPSSAAPDGPRLVTFNPTPANVSIGVDGAEPREFGPSFRDVELDPGVHRFKFVGAQDCCVDEEISVRIPPGSEPFTVTKRLKFREAGLYVVTDEPANVVVDNGAVKGRSREVLVIPNMRDVEETHHVRVTAEGYEDHTEDVRLKAGQPTTIEVTLSRREQGS